jgi:ATP-dependent RNA helicase RhlE
LEHVSVTFEQFSFDQHISAAIRTAGYSTPTPIQAEAIPIVLTGRDCLGTAQTGTGKTAAFVLPIVQQLGRARRHGVRALILAPTRELAGQTHKAVMDLSKGSGLRSVAIYGGVSKRSQLSALGRGVDIVVACPGRLLDHMECGDIDLSSVEILVLDEADRMCDMGFLPDIRRILLHVPARRQTLLFSATMPPDIRSLARNILSDPVQVQIGEMAPVETVSHVLYPVSEALKPKLLEALLSETPTGRVLVFTKTKRRAEKLAGSLAKSGHRVSALQGNMTQNRRQAAIDGFRGGRYDILVATDIAARGIDISDISHVINFDMPDTADAYTHRIGRTGRAHRTGEAFTFTSHGDEGTVHQIEKILGARIERRHLPGFEPAGPRSDVLPSSNPRRRHFQLSVSSRRQRARAR